MPVASPWRPLAAAVVAVFVGACQPSAPAIDMTDPRVTAGAERSCADLDLSEVRCTLVALRGASLLGQQRPDHGEIASRTLHEAGEAAGQSPLPDDMVVPAVVVFTMTDGSRIGVPVVCPRGADESDPACDPRTE